MRISLIFLIILLLANACHFIKGDPYKNTTISGTTTIAVDETFRPVLEAELDLFNGIYWDAEVKAQYLPENETINLLLDDSVRLIVASRMLTKEEVLRINSHQLFPRQLAIATDAIALIVHPSSPDSLISVKQLREILSGKITSWRQLNPFSPDLPIELLFDNEKSGIVRYMVDSLCHGNFSALHVAAMKSSREVVAYTSVHPGVLGLVGSSWISNKNDSLHLSFHKMINVLAVSNSDHPGPQNSYKPYQVYLAENLYPLTRKVYLINTEPRNGLLTGFASFVASDKGQRIILKSGIVPAVAPIRMVNIRPEL